MLLSALGPAALDALAPDATRRRASALMHLLWFADGLMLFFLISRVCASLLDLDNDFYYAIFIWTSLTFLHRYVRATNTDVIGALRTRWRSSLFIGGLTTIYVVVNVWNANPTEHPTGALLLFELLWRGLAYGAIDALVLTAFPLAVAHGIYGGHVRCLTRRAGLASLALLLIWAMSFCYHSGFEQFDGDVTEPQLATTVVSIPALITANPIGSVVTQTSLHLAATYRTFESDVFAPPAVEFIPEYEPPGIFGGEPHFDATSRNGGRGS